MCQENSRTELVATLFVVHCSLSFLADVYGLFNPSNGSIRFPVDHWSICPVYHMVFLHGMVRESRSVKLCWSARPLTSGKGSLDFWLNFRSAFLQPDAEFSSCFPYISFVTTGAWNFIHTLWCLFCLFFVFRMYQDISESLTRPRGTRYIVFFLELSND